MLGPSLTGIDLGYCFEPPERPDEPGHPRLAIALPAAPTLHYFDPETVCLPVVEVNSVSHQTMRHPWSGPERLTLAIGPIHIRDRNGGCAEAFTYGGDATIMAEPEYTHIVVSSPAPILNLTAADMISVPALLAAETEVLIAEARANWDRAHRHGDLEWRLGQVEPDTLYAACIAELVARFESIPCCDSHEEAFVRFLRAEQAFLNSPVTAFGAGALDFVLAHDA